MKLSPETKRGILAGKTSGMSIKDICSKFDISKATVHRVLSSSGPEMSSPEMNKVTREIPVMNQLHTTSLEFSKVISEMPTKDQTSDKPVKNQEMDSLIEDLVGNPSEEDVPEQMPSKKRTVAFTAKSLRVEEPENLELHNQLEQKIILNVQNFGPLFHFIKDKEQFIKSLHSKTNHELQGILQTLETTRTTVNLSNQMKQVFFMVSKGAEVGGAMFLKLKTDGLTDNLIRQQQELDMIFREIAIEYAPMFKMTNKPELRLAMCFTMTLIQTDSMNRLKESFQAHQFQKSSDVGNGNGADSDAPDNNSKYEGL